MILFANAKLVQMPRLPHCVALRSPGMRVLPLQLKLERILECRKVKQIPGETERRLGLLGPNGYDIKHY